MKKSEIIPINALSETMLSGSKLNTWEEVEWEQDSYLPEYFTRREDFNALPIHLKTGKNSTFTCFTKNLDNETHAKTLVITKNSWKWEGVGSHSEGFTTLISKGVYQVIK